jgi:hypothetical protein
MSNNQAMLLFVKKQKYIRAAATEFLPNGNMYCWQSGDEHWHFSAFSKHIFDRKREDVWYLAKSAYENRGVTRYFNQIRVCPVCGMADVTWVGDWEKYKRNPKEAYEEDSHDWPLTFSACRNTDECNCQPYDNMCADQCVHTALTLSLDPESDPEISHTQAAHRLGVSSYDTEIWFSELRENRRSYTFKASKIVDHLFSRVWFRGGGTQAALSALPRPDDITPRQYPLRKDAGVYFLFRQGRVVYVGQSETANTRLKAHRRGGKKFDSVAFLPVVDGIQRLGVERHYIQTMRPELNAA